MIQSPASRAARRRSCQVRSGSSAGAARAGRTRTSAASSSGSRSRRSATSSQPVGRSRRVASRKPRSTAVDQRPADAVESADPGRDPRWPARYSGSASAAKPSREDRREGVRVVDARRRAPARAPRPSGWCSATNATARSRGDRARLDGVTARRAHVRPVVPTRRGVRADQAEAVAGLELALAGLVGARRSVPSAVARTLAGRGVDDPAGGVDEPPPVVGRPSPRRGSAGRCGTGRWNVDVQPGREAPVVGRRRATRP